VEVLVHDTIPINKDTTTNRLKTANDLFTDFLLFVIPFFTTDLVKSAMQPSFQEFTIHSLK
jgi:hypothetical protein